MHIDIDVPTLNSQKYALTEATDAISILHNKLFELSKLGFNITDHLESVEKTRGHLQSKLDELNKEISRRKEDFKPWSIVFARRTVDEIPREIKLLQNKKKKAHTDAENKRQLLAKAGLSQHKIDQEIDPLVIQKIDSKITSLSQEAKQWELFNKTCLLEYLPKNAEEHLARVDPVNHEKLMA